MWIMVQNSVARLNHTLLIISQLFVKELAGTAEINATCTKLEKIVNGLQKDVVCWDDGEVATLCEYKILTTNIF